MAGTEASGQACEYFDPRKRTDALQFDVRTTAHLASLYTSKAVVDDYNQVKEGGFGAVGEQELQGYREKGYM